MLFGKQVEVFGSHENAYVDRAGDGAARGHAGYRFLRGLVVDGDVVKSDPVPEIQTGAAGEKRRGEKLVFDAGVFERANLQNALVLVAGNAEFLVRHLDHLAARAIVNGDQLRGLVDAAV